MNIIIPFLLWTIFLMPSIIIHEVSHGYVAYKLGDPTAKNSGRLTLNPISHIDPIGTILVPLIFILLPGFLILGWAKPVPVNNYNFKNPRKDMIWVGLSGPASNLAIAVFLSIIINIIGYSYISQLLTLAAILNIILAVINLIPIPPLDGSRILAGILPRELAYKYMQIEQFGMIIVFTFILLFWRTLLMPLVGIIASLLNLNFP